MIDINSSVFIQIINFIVLIIILNVVLYKPIRRILTQRKETVDGLESDIDKLADDAKEKDAAFSDGLKDARSKGMKEKEALVEAASSEEKEIVSKINQKAAEDLAKVKEQISKETDDVKATLLAEVDKFAEDISQKILGRAV
jgi:F-type H+-transporting ATPase subunit b